MPDRRQLANAIRFLAMDAVQKANSGHPGMPMGMADIAEVLWRDFLVFNPKNPAWINRDRFVLSNGHGAMLQYALLHLTGYDVSIEDIKQFRQLHAKTPGHPEYGDTPGVETTTGPLGQGLANAVGMAMAEKMLAAQFNQSAHEVIDHYTYAFVGDGCLMEGISHESCSLAGTLGLGKLIVLYDDNGISIDGDVNSWFTEDVPARFKSYGWHVIEAVDGHEAEQIRTALIAAQEQTDKPTIICCKTQIGYGSPAKAGTASAHGAPLGETEISAARAQLVWDYPPFEIPDDIRASWDMTARGQQFEDQWNVRFAKFESDHPAQAAELLRRMYGELPVDWADALDEMMRAVSVESPAQATRQASLVCLDAIVSRLPELVGGSADLSGSNCTKSSQVDVLSSGDFSGQYINYGVREFAMSAIANGLALHGGFIPFVGTFLVFSDYARNAVRLSALMRQKVVYVYSHDSIGLGEDGPTHQPIEHAAMLRMTPDLNVWRPCDAAETAVAWQHAVQHQGPSCLLLSRHKLPQYTRDMQQLELIERGGYVLLHESEAVQGVFIATGSEVTLAVQAALRLIEEGLSIRVVSMPCYEVFKMQAQDYQRAVVPTNIKARVMVEAGVTAGWHALVGDGGAVIGIDRFGVSAPADDVYAECGLTIDAILHKMRCLLELEAVETVES